MGQFVLYDTVAMVSLLPASALQLHYKDDRTRTEDTQETQVELMIPHYPPFHLSVCRNQVQEVNWERKTKQVN